MIPDFLKEMLKVEYNEDILFDSGISRCTTLRVNTIKTNSSVIQNVLREKGIDFKLAKWSNNAIILDENMEKQIQDFDIYKNGEIYLQSLSSMLPPIVLEPQPKENILDMCAAPGSKTTQIAAISENKAYITACERNPIRAEKLKYNIEMQGCKGTAIIVKDARDLDSFLKFDKILLDAPCSGSGTDNIEKNFTRELISKSIKLQSSLLNKAVKLLKPEGTLIYSTCSILKEENECQIIKLFEKHEDLEIIPIKMENIPTLPSKIDGVITIKPGRFYEGFFIAKIRKK